MDAEKNATKKPENDKKPEINNPFHSPQEHPTTAPETMIHLFKGNIGPGLFAMGDAFKNGGLLLGPLLTIAIAIICVHCQHLLLSCAKVVHETDTTKEYPDYAETVGGIFQIGPTKLRGFATRMKSVVNIFICVTQLGFCCIYFVFISTNAEKILDSHGIKIHVGLIMLFAFIPVLATSLITNLKYLAPVSLAANLGMITGLSVTLYFAIEGGLTPLSERHMYREPSHLALFFGTAIFAFEGIALVLPLKNEMKQPSNFDRPCGVLNIGMTLVACAFIFAGFFGYLKWGDDTEGSLTLNLGHSWPAQMVQSFVSFGVLFGYPLQFFIAIQIMYPSVQEVFKFDKDSMRGELLFRTFMVIITLGVAELVPNLSLFISLLGALCSTALALVFPPIIDLLLPRENAKGPGFFRFFKNISILILALLGFATGTYESLSAIIREFL